MSFGVKYVGLSMMKKGIWNSHIWLEGILIIKESEFPWQSGILERVLKVEQ